MSYDPSDTTPVVNFILRSYPMQPDAPKPLVQRVDWASIYAALIEARPHANKKHREWMQKQSRKRHSPSPLPACAGDEQLKDWGL